MVNGAVALGGIVGVLLSGAFVYWEIGRFAAPQVPQSLFDERRELFAYTAGLFVGVPIAFVYLLLTAAVANAALISAIVDLAILVVATELAEWALARSHYFGRNESTPLYALGFRAAVGGIVVVAAVAGYLGSPTLSAAGLVAVAAGAIALVSLQVGGALLSLPRAPWAPTARGGPVSGAAVGAAAYGVLVLGGTLGAEGAIAAALLVVAGEAGVYRRLRRRILDPRLTAPSKKEEGEGVPPPAERGGFGRTDR